MKKKKSLANVVGKTHLKKMQNYKEIQFEEMSMDKKQVEKSMRWPALCLGMAIATCVGAVIVGGLVYGAYTVATYQTNSPTTFGPTIAAFWGALAGGLAAFLCSIFVVAYINIVHKRKYYGFMVSNTQ